MILKLIRNYLNKKEGDRKAIDEKCREERRISVKEDIRSKIICYTGGVFQDRVDIFNKLIDKDERLSCGDCGALIQVHFTALYMNNDIFMVFKCTKCKHEIRTSINPDDNRSRKYNKIIIDNAIKCKKMFYKTLHEISWDDDNEYEKDNHFDVAINDIKQELIKHAKSNST